LRHERARQVRAGLRRLKALDRKTLVAFYVDGQSLAEMSTKFASPIGTIKRRLHTARKRLAVELEAFAGA
jgi:RNA polymerase sigma-70 factor (ECF subfamily)